jgi:hypothetical protein
MKYFICFVIAFAFLSASFARQSVNVKSNDTPIYSARTGDKEKGKLSGGTKCAILKKGKDRSLVKTRSGMKGWVQNTAIEYIKGGKGDIYNLSEQEVHGWLDNPSAIYILDNSGLNTDALPLSRNFSDEVFELQDREDMERGNDEN